MYPHSIYFGPLKHLYSEVTLRPKYMLVKYRDPEGNTLTFTGALRDSPPQNPENLNGLGFRVFGV